MRSKATYHLRKLSSSPSIAVGSLTFDDKSESFYMRQNQEANAQNVHYLALANNATPSKITVGRKKEMGQKRRIEGERREG